MCIGVGFQCGDVAGSLVDERFRVRKATRLLGLLARLETMTMDDLRHANSRSTFYSDKGELRELGLWPPSVGTVSLPALEMPQLENLLSAEATFSNSSNTEEANENAITI